MERPTDPPPASTAGVLKLIFEALHARASYTTRVWTALLWPIAGGTAFSWPTMKIVQMLLLSVLVVVIYTVAQWIWKKHLK